MKILGMRAVKVAAIVAIMVGGVGGTAWARTGYDANAKSVVFYFGETAGQGDSQNFAGYGSVKLCTDADNSGGNGSYGAEYIRNRGGGLPDDSLLKYNVSYSQGAFASGSFNTSSADRFHTKAVWGGVPSAPDNADGFVATRTASLSCP